jgi:ribosome production factor 2
MIRKDYSKKLSKKNILNSDQHEIEFFCEQNDTSLFCYASDTKKKPMNLVLGSLFDNKVLDSFEFEVANFIPIEYFSKSIEVDSYMKPIIIFQGDLFETDFELDRIRKFFIDFFRIKDLEEVDISDLRRIVVVSVAEDREIKIRSFQTNKFNQYTVKFSFI